MKQKLSVQNELTRIAGMDLQEIQDEFVSLAEMHSDISCLTSSV